MSSHAKEKFYPITNRLVFGRIFSDPDNVRPLLEAVLGVPIGEIRYVSDEHAIEPSLLGKGVRMDVFVDDGSGTVYDVEMQNIDEGNLALRSRYLLSSFDRDRIGRGDSYTDLKGSIVIFVCEFDPLGVGDRVYVVQPMVRGRNLAFDDRTLRVFLNAKGAANRNVEATPVFSEGCAMPSSRLSAFLSYVDGGGTMDDEWVQRLDSEVRQLNDEPGWRDTMVSYEMILEDERRIARKAGREEGRAEGREEGRAEGRAEEAELNRRLVAMLVAAGRIDELPDAVRDPAVREKLFEELGSPTADGNSDGGSQGASI